MYIYLLLLSSVLCAPLNSDLESINEFTFRLLDNIAAVNDGNFAVSPISLWNVYSLIAEGAAGSTFDQLMLQLKLPKDPKATQALHKAVDGLFRTSNSDVVFNRKAALFAECSLNVHEEFCQSAYRYNTEVISIDANNKTKLANDINYYICIATEGYVKGVVDEQILEDLKLLLVDAMYFKANWTYPFDPLQTKRETFYDEHGRTLGTVNMMYQKAPNTVSYIDEIEAEVLEMTYGKKEDYSMIILQAYQGISVKKLLKSLTKTPFKNWSRKLLISDNLPSIDCYVPRFKVSSKLDLVKPLQYMGIYEVFDPIRAQLPGISDSLLHVSRTVQKVEMEVNEEGTEAAVATFVGLEDRVLGQRVEVNKPFVYLIVEKKNDLVLFAGVYNQPSVV